jgi:ABC-type transporter Mla MlaB component
MLRITSFDIPAEQRLVLEGRLTEPWVAELKSAWEKARTERQGRKCVIDLSGVTVIDQYGKKILTAMCNEGARFVAQGVATIHLIKEIECRCSQHSANTMSEKH